MSTTNDETPDETSNPDLDGVPDREHVLQVLGDAFEECNRKGGSGNGRIRSPENEKVRVSYIRALGYLASQIRQIRRDRDLEALEAEVQDLRQRVEGTEPASDATDAETAEEHIEAAESLLGADQ